MIPRSAVRVGRHPQGAGWARVVHRATGIQLGEVVLWPDGAWIAYTAAPNTGGACLAGDGATREDAVELVLYENAHMPGGYDLVSGRKVLRPATEAEARTIDPAGWAWWDRVRPLFPDLGPSA